ncbi:MAG TPA: MFS transporter [Candidatus Saccharimonadales bacterium]|nr:MFS transporter [Candidatus Saccharimonadales bacterium]
MDDQSNAHAKSRQSIFYNLLGNTLVTSIVNYTVWFSLTYFIYLQTRSVLATAIIAGLNLLFTTVTGFLFGSIVDHHKKKWSMLVSSIGSLTLYAICFVLYLMVGEKAFADPTSAVPWLFAALLMTGVILGNVRTIAMPTLVSMLIPENSRDKANGLVGAAAGVSFLLTAVMSGLLVGMSGMLHVLLLAIFLTMVAIGHLLVLKVPEKGIVHSADAPKKIDIKGTIKIITSVPSLFSLILFTTFNNFLGGIFMALMDPYGLSLVSVQSWGLIWGLATTGFIVGGIIISKTGLGKRPLKTLLLVNVALWLICSLFTVQASIILLAIGLFMYLCLMPFAEATEQTILQKLIPLERQGRVFGFAQSLEQAAAPLTAFLIGPITQLFFIPFMTDGAGVKLIGSWYGTGPSRGIALVFTVAGLIGLIATAGALASRHYRRLSEEYENTSAQPAVAPKAQVVS